MSFPFIIVVPALKVDGMALFPFILVRNAQLKENPILIRHETIHFWQEVELLIIPFYILYLANYIVNRFKHQNHHKAYLNIVFEREAYMNEANPNYLKKRKAWAWFKFIGNESATH